MVRAPSATSGAPRGWLGCRVSGAVASGGIRFRSTRNGTEWVSGPLDRGTGTFGNGGRRCVVDVVADRGGIVDPDDVLPVRQNVRHAPQRPTRRPLHGMLLCLVPVSVTVFPPPG